MQAKNDIDEISQIGPMGLKLQFEFLSAEIACFTCKFAEFYIDSYGLSYKCKNSLKYRQNICYELGTARIFDESKKSPEAGLYNCECETCGSKFEAYSVMNICQDCYMQAEYENQSDDDDQE